MTSFHARPVDKAYQDTVINVLATMSVDEVRSLFVDYIPFKELEA